MPLLNKDLKMINNEGEVVDVLAEGDWKEYRSRGTLMAIKMKYPFTCLDDVGVEEKGETGDYMCMGVSGRLWAISAEVFEMTYDPTEA